MNTDTPTIATLASQGGKARMAGLKQHERKALARSGGQARALTLPAWRRREIARVAGLARAAKSVLNVETRVPKLETPTFIERRER